MLFVRGHPAKYEEWRDSGCPGWGYDDVLPYFLKLEDCAFGDSQVRGKGGPVRVTRLRGDRISNAFLDACEEAGYRKIEDYNDGNPEGAAHLQLTTSRGLRCSAAAAYLNPAKRRTNLRILTGAIATKIVFDGKRAAGVEFLLGNERRAARARREVLLCAGAIRSPQLLELSGIGNADTLKHRGIEIVAHLPGVGENLQDHLMPRVTVECTEKITVNDLLKSKWRLARDLARYVFFRDGLFATPSLTGLAYVRTRPELTHPDARIQIGLVSGASRFSTSKESGLDPFSGFHLGGYFIYPRSRGSVHIGDRDPHNAPIIRANYLSDPLDRDATVATLKIIRRIMAQPALQRFIVREVRPGLSLSSDGDLLEYVRETGQTCWHPSGTCKMGSDASAVVDSTLNVRGVEKLRVVDTSVMPFLVASNTNIPTIMIAERAASMIMRSAA